MAGIAWPGGLDAIIPFTRDICKLNFTKAHEGFSKAFNVFNEEINVCFGSEIQPQDHCPSSYEAQVQLPLLCPAHTLNIQLYIIFEFL